MTSKRTNGTATASNSWWCYLRMPSENKDINNLSVLVLSLLVYKIIGIQNESSDLTQSMDCVRVFKSNLQNTLKCHISFGGKADDFESQLFIIFYSHKWMNKLTTRIFSCSISLDTDSYRAFFFCCCFVRFIGVTNSSLAATECLASFESAAVTFNL